MKNKKKPIYRIKGDHPVARYITWTATTQEEMEAMVRELESNGYEVTVQALDELTNKAIS